MESWLVLMLMMIFIIQPIHAAGCIEEERKALLEIKASLVHHSYVPPTWVDHGHSGGECCDWERVKCNATTGHVTDLSLSHMVGGIYRCSLDRIWPLNVSLFLHFKELRSLNLSLDCLDNGIVSTGLDAFSSLKKLEILDLSGNRIGNDIFPSLGGLTSLRALHLGGNDLEGYFPALGLENLEVLDLTGRRYDATFRMQGFERISIFRKLKILNLGSNNFKESLLTSLSALPMLRALDLNRNRQFLSFLAQELSHLTKLEKLDLSYNRLNRTPSIGECKSLSRLKHLESIALAYNNLNKSIISCLSALPSLKILDLSWSSSLGSTSFPIQDLSSLRKLETLDMSGCNLESLSLNGTINSNLVRLNLDFNNFNEDVMRSMAAFPSLRFLSLHYCRMGGTLSAEGFAHFHHLEVLDLSGNIFVGSIPSTIQTLSALKGVSFANNKLNGSLPDTALCELKNLRELDLSENMFDGNLPPCFSSMSYLKMLDISSNQFTGMLPSSLIVNLTSLVYIDFGRNKFEGSFSFSSFSNLTKLEVVYLDNDNDRFMVETENPTGWIPMFQLKVLALPNCNINRAQGVVPGFLLHQHMLQILDLSHNSLKGHFPNWLIQNNTKLEILKLRNNSFGGVMSMPMYRNANTQTLDISGNCMNGTIPNDIKTFLPNMARLKLSDNALSGAIPSSIGHLSQLRLLDLSDNELSGEVPKGFFTNLSYLEILKLSKNKLHGEVLSRNLRWGSIGWLYLDSNCFTGKIGNSVSDSLSVLDISNNYFTGVVPGWISNMSYLSELVMRNNRLGGPFPCGRASFSFLDISQNAFSGPIPSCFDLQSMKHLHLGSNRFTGSIPSVFRNLTNVLTLDIGDNSLSGKIPKFLGELTNLRILVLGKNNFSGSVPKQLCQLSNASFIDLSANSLSGSIPGCLQNITGPIHLAFMKTLTVSSGVSYNEISGMVLPKFSPTFYYYEVYETQDEVQFTTKYLSLSYKGEILDNMTGIDLSCNKLTGKIPEELGSLTQIHVLNMSHNQLTGPIPVQFSNLKSIESLDLSSNGLTGKVPSQLIKLTSLAVFNVSYNNLSGKLPEMNAQFSTFTEASYEGNPLLCGPPLKKKCTTMSHEVGPSAEDESNEKWYDMDMACFYGSFSSTLVVFIMGFAAVLYTNPHWRRRWMHFVEECMYTCYYFLYDSIRKVTRKVFHN